MAILGPQKLQFWLFWKPWIFIFEEIPPLLKMIIPKYKNLSNSKKAVLRPQNGIYCFHEKPEWQKNLQISTQLGWSLLIQC